MTRRELVVGFAALGAAPTIPAGPVRWWPIADDTPEKLLNDLRAIRKRMKDFKKSIATGEVTTCERRMDEAIDALADWIKAKGLDKVQEQ